MLGSAVNASVSYYGGKAWLYSTSGAKFGLKTRVAHTLLQGGAFEGLLEGHRNLERFPQALLATQQVVCIRIH